MAGAELAQRIAGLLRDSGAAYAEFDDSATDGQCWIVDSSDSWRAGLAEAIAAELERGYYISPRPTPEQLATLPRPRRRLKACVENWPGAEIDGDYDPRCCRFPKSCSASVYDDEHVTDDDLEPQR